MDTQRILHEVEAEITKLQSIADVLRGYTSNGSGSNGQRRVMSAAARKKISLAQKARWAKSATNGHAATAKPKRTISAAGRRRIAAAQRARWAKAKAQ